jgi:hypothetical protein
VLSEHIDTLKKANQQSEIQNRAASYNQVWITIALAVLAVVAAAFVLRLICVRFHLGYLQDLDLRIIEDTCGLSEETIAMGTTAAALVMWLTRRKGCAQAGVLTSGEKQQLSDFQAYLGRELSLMSDSN